MSELLEIVKEMNQSLKRILDLFENIIKYMHELDKRLTRLEQESNREN